MGGPDTDPGTPPRGGLPDRILVVDDDLFVRSVVIAVLKEAGVERVKACASGEEALAVAPEFHPRLVLMDHSMSGLTGRATWKTLRTLVSPAPSAIFLTARPGPEGPADGVLGVIPKPFNPLLLANQVRALLGRDDSAEGSAGTDRLAAVAAEYRRALPDSAQALTDLWAEIQTQAWRRETGESLLSKAHNLAGSAGLFGLYALGSAAETAEGLLSKTLKRDVAPDAYELRQVEAAVAALIAACRT